MDIMRVETHITVHVEVNGKASTLDEAEVRDMIDDLTDSVRDFRDPKTPDREREYLLTWWKMLGIKNQFQALELRNKLQWVQSGDLR